MSQCYNLPSWLFQFRSVAQSCPILCDPMDRSMPGFPVHHQLLELARTHVHQVGDTIQPSHPLLSPSPPVFNLPQHRGLCQWVSSSHQVASALALVPLMNIEDWFPLGLTVLVIYFKSLLQCHSSKASVLRCSAFFIVQLSHPHMIKGPALAAHPLL